MTGLAIYASMLLAGVAGSLHCVGMCGPLLLGFAGAGNDGEPGRGRREAVSFLWYHLGRIWTYMLLGLVAGAVGSRIAPGAAWIGWQRGAALVLSVVVLATGIVMLGLGPRLASPAWIGGCAAVLRGPLRLLNRAPGRSGRFLLGAVMGLLPCGLVYAMLALGAALSSPWRAALGMLVFGLGTVPSLTAVLALAAAIPARLRAQGSRLAALVVAATGIFMLVRALSVLPGPGGCGRCAGTTQVAPPPPAPSRLAITAGWPP